MKIILAPDSFKESMTAQEVCQAMAKGIYKALPNAEITSVPMADGGEGTVSAITSTNKGKLYEATVTGPNLEKVTANYGIIKDSNSELTAIIEMAQASGIGYILNSSRTPTAIKNATSYGTGELIIAALNRGVTKFIIGLGGSATNDGGAGMAQALGVKFFNDQDELIEKKLGGGDLASIAKIDLSQLDPRLKNANFILASDVTNPLTGPNGASFTFGKQKGADVATQHLLDNNLKHYSNLIEKLTDKQIANLPGSGAAGGLAVPLLAFVQTKIKAGVQVVAAENHLEDKIKDADLVFTGEGGTDFQTKYGKTPFGVAQIAKKYNLPVISLAGYLGQGIDQLYDHGFTAIFGILGQPSSLQAALENGSENIERTTENIMRLILKIEQ